MLGSRTKGCYKYRSSSVTIKKNKQRRMKHINGPSSGKRLHRVSGVRVCVVYRRVGEVKLDLSRRESPKIHRLPLAPKPRQEQGFWFGFVYRAVA